MSPVLYPDSKTLKTALSINAASSSSLNVCLSIILPESIVARGFAIPLPAISGALPCIGSYIPKLFFPNDADGSIPIDPVTILASSDNISPNIFEVTITSNCLGSLTICIAALSIYK